MAKSYTQTNWIDGQAPVINAENLNNMEQGIADAIEQANANETAVGNKAPLASPNFTGTPTAPTAASGTNTTQIATTAFVKDAVDNVSIDLDDTLTEQGKAADAKAVGDALVELAELISEVV